MTTTGPGSYAAFTAALLAIVGIDLWTSSRRTGPPAPRVTMIWTIVWIGLATGFALWVAATRGPDHGLSFAAAYLTEESLSLDNMVVFIAVFSTFAIPVALEHRV